MSTFNHLTFCYFINVINLIITRSFTVERTRLAGAREEPAGFATPANPRRLGEMCAAGPSVGVGEIHVHAFSLHYEVIQNLFYLCSEYMKSMKLLLIVFDESGDIRRR